MSYRPDPAAVFNIGTAMGGMVCVVKGKTVVRAAKRLSPNASPMEITVNAKRVRQMTFITGPCQRPERGLCGDLDAELRGRRLTG